MLWLVGLGWGTAVMFRYGGEEGAAGQPPSDWPAESQIHRQPGVPTLVLLVHPQCPCTRATVGELARLMAHAQGKVSAHVLFAKPAGAPEHWERGELWDEASAIPGVETVCDEGGVEAKRLRVETSGQALLFSADGHLIFRGGITPARGHMGENAGSESVAAYLEGKQAPVAQARVFGCSLF